MQAISTRSTVDSLTINSLPQQCCLSLRFSPNWLTSKASLKIRNLRQIFMLQIYLIFYVPVPPEKPKIYDERSQEVRLKLGPYKIGDIVLLKCVSNGGNPSYLVRRPWVSVLSSIFNFVSKYTWDGYEHQGRPLFGHFLALKVAWKSFGR